jgi:hypothetical protein
LVSLIGFGGMMSQPHTQTRLVPSRNHGYGNTRHSATFVALTDDDMQDTEVQKMQEVFNQTLCEALGHGIEKADYPEDKTPKYEPYQDDQIENNGLLGQMSNQDSFEHDFYGHYLTAEALLPILQGTMKTYWDREQTSFAGYSQVCY